MTKVFLIGRLAADPELRTTGSGTAVCRFRLAVQRPFTTRHGQRPTGGRAEGGQTEGVAARNPRASDSAGRGATREADFFQIIAWRQLGENCARYLGKGRQCAVTGALQTRIYDSQDGSKRYVTEIIADEVEFLGSKQDAKSDPEAPSAAEQFQETDEYDDQLPF